MNYRDLLNCLLKLSEDELNKMVQIYDYKTDTISEDWMPSFEFGPDDYPYITIN